MAEPKPLASLSAGLLARKGAARPAMRRQTQSTGFTGSDDLGWNDMGYDVPAQDHAADIGRMAGGALSPMGHRGEAAPAAFAAEYATPPADAMDALSAAVDRAMGDAVVQPLSDTVAVPQTAEAPAVHHQRERIERALAEPVAEAAPAVVAPQAAPPARASRTKAPGARVRAGTRGSFAFTLRLDPGRHLRLRLASALTNRSAQQIMIQLVDDYFASQPEIDAVAERLPASKRAV